MLNYKTRPIFYTQWIHIVTNVKCILNACKLNVYIMFTINCIYIYIFKPLWLNVLIIQSYCFKSYGPSYIHYSYIRVCNYIVVLIICIHTYVYRNLYTYIYMKGHVCDTANTSARNSAINAHEL